MKKLLTIIVALIALVVGVFLALMDAFVWKTPSSIVLNIGCSLIASSLVILLTELLVNREKKNSLDAWGIKRIYITRTERNRENDPDLDKTQYRIDAIVFGLSSFRTQYSNKIEACLRNGVSIRILTMHPESKFLAIRENEENAAEGHIKQTIEDMITWADSLNNKKYKGNIIVKGYTCMTLDFYWRVDDTVYIGPYWYGYQSGDTITYSFSKGGKGFQHYSDYFEKLWDDEEICTILTKAKKEKMGKKNAKKALDNHH